jgi:D-alanyl-D-alanine carboxypeptidase
MNATARQLGMQATSRFINPNGLPGEGQYYDGHVTWQFWP